MCLRGRKKDARRCSRQVSTGSRLESRANYPLLRFPIPLSACLLLSSSCLTACLLTYLPTCSFLLLLLLMLLLLNLVLRSSSSLFSLRTLLRDLLFPRREARSLYTIGSSPNPSPSLLCSFSFIRGSGKARPSLSRLDTREKAT